MEDPKVTLNKLNSMKAEAFVGLDPGTLALFAQVLSQVIPLVTNALHQHATGQAQPEVPSEVVQRR